MKEVRKRNPTSASRTSSVTYSTITIKLDVDIDQLQPPSSKQTQATATRVRPSLMANPRTLDGNLTPPAIEYLRRRTLESDDLVLNFPDGLM